MKRLTAILFSVGLALMARAETRLGDVVMKDVVVLEPVDKTNLLNAVNALTNGAALGETALQPSWAETGTVFRATEVTGAQSALIATAWQNPASAVDWTWTSNGREITLTGYSGPNAVVLPDMLDGLPVTGFGGVFSSRMDITSVGGGANIKAIGTDAFYDCRALISVSLTACNTVGDYAFVDCGVLSSVSLPACTTVGEGAFSNCANLNSVSLPACTTVGDGAFSYCDLLISVSLPACTTVGDYAFVNCANLNSVSLPACTTVGDYAFVNCGTLSSVTFGQNAPAQTANVFKDSTPTIYVSNPHATGWGDTWNGRPVVRAASMPDIADHNTDGTAHADIRQAIDGLTDAPEWIGITNLAASVTVTNVNERPIFLYATGTVSVTFSGLRTPMPLYLVLRGPDSLTFPGAYYVGGGSWQTNMSNHFVVWKYGTNLFINPVTATED